ncbi:hypothetical protein ACIOHC_35775 [Streptomyces sp. NPDC088252]|uniref:hypothetical protein n=1 Tax=Streptomyces sp. NPDC088252 TaxID=3365845 RepID=UPI00381720F9
MDGDLRECRSCHQIFPISTFKGRGNRNPGQRHTMCNRCLYVRYTRPAADKKTKEVQDYKVRKGCVDCGYNNHPAALEFDHLPEFVKKFNIMEKVGSYSMKKIWEEIAKCDVVCANCHAVRTNERRARVEVSDCFV